MGWIWPFCRRGDLGVIFLMFLRFFIGWVLGIFIKWCFYDVPDDHAYFFVFSEVLILDDLGFEPRILTILVKYIDAWSYLILWPKHVIITILVKYLLIELKCEVGGWWLVWKVEREWWMTKEYSGKKVKGGDGAIWWSRLGKWDK